MAKEDQPEFYLIPTDVFQRMLNVLTSLPYNTINLLIPDIQATAKPYFPKKADKKKKSDNN